MKFHRVFALGLVLLAGWTCPCRAAIFLRLQGITGTSADSNHLGWIEVQTADTANLVAITLTNQIPPSGSPFIPPAVMDELSFGKNVDSASPTLALKCAQTNLISDGTLDFLDTAPPQMRYFRLNLTNIYVTRVVQTGSDAEPTEQLFLLPQGISWTYNQNYNTDGLPKAYWSSRWNTAGGNSGPAMSQASFRVSGIIKTNVVQISWAAIAGRSYRVFGVPSLTQPFQTVKELTASFTGNTNYTFTPVLPAMFFVVEELPNGY